MRRRVIFWMSIFWVLLAYLQNAGLAQEKPQKAVLIIASNDFRDEELLLPKDMLETNRVEVVIASLTTSPVRGMLGTVIKPDILIEEIKVDDYDAVIFVGGSGAREYWDNEVAHNIAQHAQQAQKIIGAICLAPVTLARAGILKEKNATVWSGVSAELKAGGVNYTGNDVEIDGNIITANGPQTAGKFAEALVTALVQRR